jgi:hypothetical protein
MKEEDDMLELLDEGELGSKSSDDEELELTDDSDDESYDDSLELDDTDEDSDDEDSTAAFESEGVDESEGSDDSKEVTDEENEGLVIDIRYVAVAAIALIAILIGVVFMVLPMMADDPPQVSFSPSQAGEDLFLTHNGGDALNPEHLIVLINGAPVPEDSYFLMGGASWPWTSGVVLRIDTSGYSKPATVTMVYKPKSLDHVIYGTTVQPTPTPTPLPTPEPIITPEPVIGPDGGFPGVDMATIPGGSPLPTGATELVVSSSVVMSVEPASGSAPLSVQCTDLTNGCIRNRVWNFGDGQTSMRRNPEYVFPFPGTYNVTLDVRFCDPDDNPAELPMQTVTVLPTVRQDTLVQGTGTAQVLVGGKLFFSVKGPGTNIRIAGRDHYLKVGDTVQLTVGDGIGDISIVSRAILRFNFNNVTMTVNGEDIETGTLSVININQYLYLETADLTIKILAGRDGAKGMVDAYPVISAGPGQQITLNNVGVDSTGKLLFSGKDSAGFNFRGGIASYEVNTPPPL